MKKHILLLSIAATLFVSCDKNQNIPSPVIPTKPVQTVDSLRVGLVAYYTFDNTGADSSGYKNDGKVHEISSVPDRWGTANSAYYFNGYSSYIEVKDNQKLRLNGTDFTLSMWINLNSYASAMLLSKRQSGYNNGWQWSIINHDIAPTGSLSYGPGGGSLNAFGNKVIGLGSWHMLTSTYTLATGKFSIYIDGLLDQTTVGVLSPNAAITNTLYIGKDDPSNFPAATFNGAMDDVRIYNRALTTKEILNLYALTPGNTDSLK